MPGSCPKKGQTVKEKGQGAEIGQDPRHVLVEETGDGQKAVEGQGRKVSQSEAGRPFRQSAAPAKGRPLPEEHASGNEEIPIAGPEDPQIGVVPDHRMFGKGPGPGSGTGRRIPTPPPQPARTAPQILKPAFRNASLRHRPMPRSSGTPRRSQKIT